MPNRSHVFRRLGAASTVVLLCAVLADPALADPVKCQRAILKRAAKLAQTSMQALQKCEDRVLKGSVAGPCPDERTALKIAKAESKLRKGLDQHCGGSDKKCGTTGDNDPLASIGWDLGTCPNFETGGCDNPIAHCADVATCLVCIADKAVNQAIDLYYDAITPSLDRDTFKCQRAIGKESVKFFRKKSNFMRKCRDQRLKSGSSEACPDPLTAFKIDKAESKKVQRICKACGGGDRECGGGDDLTPEDIGFVDTCPDVTVPGGASCGGPVADLQALVDCVDCVTEFKADCLDSLSALTLQPYPAECAQVQEPCTLPNPIPDRIVAFVKPPVDLDTGWKGISHDLPGTDDALVSTVRVSNCDTDPGSPTCGRCDISGPIDFPGPAKQCMCTNLANLDTSSLDLCDPEAPACTGGETCECFYGPPLPLSSGATPVCVTNRYAAPLSGTANIAQTGPNAGTGEVFLQLRSSVHTGLLVDKPCPTCESDPTPRDGVRGGTCSGGARDGLSCDVAGTNVFFGDVSHQCPPLKGANVGNLTVTFDKGTTGTTTLAANVPCSAPGFGGINCFCDTCATINAEPCATAADCPGGATCGGPRCQGGSNPGTPCTVPSDCNGGQCGTPGLATQPNQCQNSVCDPHPSGGQNEGLCSQGPFDFACSSETFRGCNNAADCNPPPQGNCASCAPGQQCVADSRECFLDPIVRTGTPGVDNQVFAATFCIPPTTAQAVNNVAGLPGPGAVLQPTCTFQLGPDCGNGAVDLGEECDPPADGACPGACGIDCQCPGDPVCGDGTVNQGSEECDGGDDTACPGACQADCTCGPFCGDDTINQGAEECDGTDDAACPGVCQPTCLCPVCGDDVVNQGSEECDGAADAACPGACQVDCTCGPFCGDDVANQPSEQCDGSDTGICPGTCEGDCTCAPFCGDGVAEAGEQCDGGDDGACPGECAADCTCPPIGELSYVIGDLADLDTGWTGTSHDFGLQAGTRVDGVIAGCDPVVDPECSYFANVGSFCTNDPARNCAQNSECDLGDTCERILYGPPLPLSSGGVPVCVVNVHAQDIVGTYRLDTGEGALTARLRSVVHLGTNVSRPCPICDCGELDPGDCEVGDPGQCSDNPTVSCTVEGVGPFGPTSNDCPPNPGSNISGGGLDILFDPVSTGLVSFASNQPCTGSGFTSESCWCSGQLQPNDCNRGCDGGSRDGLACTTDGDCPGAPAGACKLLCRQIAGEALGEGECVAGPVTQTCAGASEIGCSDTQPCPLGLGPCVTAVQRCFIDPIERQGSASTTEITGASIFCIPATSSPAVNNTAGLPGPGSVLYQNFTPRTFCGDGVVNGTATRPEECDPPADGNCPGACAPNCSCTSVCGNDLTEFGEQCDGTDDGACPGQCAPPGGAGECTCPAVCGDGFRDPTEECDPGGPGGVPPPDDPACPGACAAVTCTCPAPVCGNGQVEAGEVCELPAVGCGALQQCVLCQGCAP